MAVNKLNRARLPNGQNVSYSQWKNSMLLLAANLKCPSYGATHRPGRFAELLLQPVSQ